MVTAQCSGCGTLSGARALRFSKSIWPSTRYVLWPGTVRSACGAFVLRSNLPARPHVRPKGLPLGIRSEWPRLEYQLLPLWSPRTAADTICTLWMESTFPTCAILFAGDLTDQLMWRLKNGELPTRPPRVAALLIGTNDVGVGVVDLDARYKAVLQEQVMCVAGA